MHLVVLTRLHFYWKYLPSKFDNEIQLSTFLTIVIIRLQSMCHQFLSYCILVNRTIVNVLVSLDYPHLNPFRILSCQKTDVILEKFE